jgi:hypothetical protein
MDGQNLAYHPRDGAVPNEFDRRMMALIDQPAVIPLRLTNRHSLVGDQVHGFHSRILGDGFESGYVDIDDLLASTDLALEVAMVHFLTERASAARYVHRIGIDPPNPGALRPEFNRAHARGIDAEVEVVRDFFGDPSIQFVSAFGVGPGGGTFRTYRNNRRDVIRFRVRTSHGANEGLDVLSIDVLMADGTTVRTAEEYRAILHPPP